MLQTFFQLLGRSKSFANVPNFYKVNCLLLGIASPVEHHTKGYHPANPPVRMGPIQGERQASQTSYTVTGGRIKPLRHVRI